MLCDPVRCCAILLDLFVSCLILFGPGSDALQHIIIVLLKLQLGTLVQRGIDPMPDPSEHTPGGRFLSPPHPTVPHPSHPTPLTHELPATN